MNISIQLGQILQLFKVKLQPTIIKGIVAMQQEEQLE